MTNSSIESLRGQVLSTINMMTLFKRFFVSLFDVLGQAVLVTLVSMGVVLVIGAYVDPKSISETLTLLAGKPEAVKDVAQGCITCFYIIAMVLLSHKLFQRL